MSLDPHMKALMERAMKPYIVLIPIKPRPEPRIGGGDRDNLPVGYTFQSDNVASGFPLNTQFVQLPDGDWVPLVYLFREYVAEMVETIPDEEIPTKVERMTVIFYGADGRELMTRNFVEDV